MQRAIRMRRLGDAHYWSLLLSLMLTAGVALGQEVAPLSRATTSRAAREDAIRSIPFPSLSGPAQQRIVDVVTKPTMYRRMPISVIDCDPELHQFVIRHPESMVNIWQLMGITNLTAKRVGEYMLQCSDGVGTTTQVELIYGDQDTHILFCEGAYDGPLFRKPLTGRCVLMLKSGASDTRAGQTFVSNRLDVFLQIDHAGLDIFAKTLHPLLGKSADMNFMESMRFLERLSQAAQVNGDGMLHMVGRLDDLQPPVRSQFQQVVANVNSRHGQRAAALSETQPDAPSSAVKIRAAGRKPVTLRAG